ncbi:MAG: CsgG/HfaB family protein [Bacteroidota bacterium]
MKKLFTFLIALVGISNLTNSQTFESFIISPPEKYLVGVKNIAFLDFENFNKDNYYNTYGGSAFVNYLSSAFSNETRGIYTLSGSGWFSGSKEGKTYIKSNGINKFQIIERGQLDKVLKEKNLGSNLALSDNQAAEVGKVLGIDALITGTIKYSYNTNRTYSTYKDGSVVYTTENSCATEITVKIISVANAQVIASKTFYYTAKDAKSGSDESKVSTFDQLAPFSLQVIAFQIANYISPSYVYIKAEFGKIKVAEFKEKAKKVGSYLESGDLKSAYALYKAIYDADNYNAIAAYNLSQLYLITGDYEEASKWCEIATQIDSKEYYQSGENIKKWAASTKTLKEIGINIEKYDFSTNNDVLAQKTKTKGKKADRFDVYEKADKSSAVLSKVPGDTEFVVIEKSGEFVKIKLLGGKEGYISKVNVSE